MAVPGYPLHERVEATGYQAPRQWWPGVLLAAFLMLIGAVGAVIVGGQLVQFMLAGLQVFPFAVLAFFAYLGLRQGWARVVAFLCLFALLLGLAAVSILSVLGVLLIRAQALAGSPDPAKLVAAITSPQLGVVTIWMIVGLAVAGLLLLPPVRRAAAQVLPIDPRSSVHAIALSIVVGSTIMSFGQLVAAGGVPPILEMVKAVPEATNKAKGDTSDLLVMIYGFAWTFPGALVAGGFPVVRTLREVLRRLGLVRPTTRQVLGAIGLAVLLAAASMLLDAGIGRLWDYMGWARTDNAAFEKLLGSAVSLPGAVVIGITAGLGEETVVRGVLQPRLGILLSNLFFASLHAFQYGFDAVLSVFIIGLILGIVRSRSNTTTSSIVHGTYDFILISLSALKLFQ